MKLRSNKPRFTTTRFTLYLFLTGGASLVARNALYVQVKLNTVGDAWMDRRKGKVKDLDMESEWPNRIEL